MGLTVAGADRFLRAITGQVVTAPTTIRSRLHSAVVPTADNVLSGNGYSDVVIQSNEFSVSRVDNYDRLFFPELEFYSSLNSGSSVDVSSTSLWHDNDLIWSFPKSFTLTPGARIVSPINELYIDIARTGRTITLTESAMSRAMLALAGGALSSENFYWVFHSDIIPSRQNTLMEGGLLNQLDTPWLFETVNNWRAVFVSREVLFSSRLTAALSRQPNSLALWSGLPDRNGTLFAYRLIEEDNQPALGSSVKFIANSLRFEINLEGVVR